MFLARKVLVGFFNLILHVPKTLYTKKHSYFAYIFIVEELTCLATWKDGNARYLVGLVSHHHATSNEERFRCFVYEKIQNSMGMYRWLLFFCYFIRQKPTCLHDFKCIVLMLHQVAHLKMLNTS